MSDTTHRRLAAILALDVVGFSRLMGTDEVGTLNRLKKLHKNLIKPSIVNHGGRIVKLMGDGLLAEFASVVQSVECAAGIQQSMLGFETESSEQQSIKLRVGVNLGDIIVEGSDIFGDGVNVAARLESLATPGGICISGKVHEEVRDRLNLTFEDMGEQEVKNISRPVRVWQWNGNQLSASRRLKQLSPEPPPLPAGQSIAVLPFNNMSGDSEQEYFADGITEDIITDLSKLSGLFVIARNSTFSFKDQHVNARQIADELGVKYVMEGSVRKAGNRIRINAQLIDGENGAHIWAERYDRVLNDIFAIQDEITESIVQALKVKLEIGEKDRIGGKLTNSVEAYDFALRAREQMYRMTPQANAEARSLYESSLALDPDFSRAHSELAIVLFTAYTSRWNNSSPETLKLGVLHAKNAIELAPKDARAHRAMAYGHLWSGDLDNAVIEIDVAVLLGTNTADVFSAHGYILSFAGRGKEAIASIEKALRLDPEHPAIWLHFLGHAHFVDENYEAAIPPLEKRIAREPYTDLSRALLAVCFGLLGLREQAQYQWTELIKIHPDYVTKIDGQMAKYKDPAVSDRFMEGLRVAGIDA